ncbi:alpha/beta fold hydrolase [Pseudonocardia acaciae]|uniref:alpha/beta fold hydrolase n=1 Tax=Pseudonocardia acaciae TaxID=551276 RepID=UPI00048CBADF|nr:alpha/beta hydrolase family protein [Pseudonocardia acaciae]
MADPPVHRFPGRDGLELVYRETGEGRPLVLLPGFTSTGLHWIHRDPVATLAEHGYRVILPDPRGHGDSARPHDPRSYPPDVLADDGLALINWLRLDDYDLGGYSLGARIVPRMLVRGVGPAHAIVAGQGLDALDRTTSRAGRRRHVLSALTHRGVIEPGSPDEELARWITQSGGDPQALCHVLDTLVATLPSARFTRVPGNHVTALTSPELVAAITAFLARSSSRADLRNE